MILITGHRGFIGTHLCKILAAQGIAFTGYDLVDGDDIRDKEKLEKIFKEGEFTAVIHLAAKTGARDGETMPDEYMTTNVIGTEYLLRFASKYGVKSFILFSSSAVYGPQPSPKGEDAPMMPQNLYGATKSATEMLMYCSSKIPQRVIIRPFTVYGEHGRPAQVLYKWIGQIKNDEPVTFYGDGTTKRGYTYVGDLINGVLAVLKKCDTNSLSGVHLYNLGGSEIITLQMLHDLFTKYSPKSFKTEKLPLAANDTAESWGNLTKAKEELGYEPRTQFEEKVGEIIKSELG